MARENSIGLPVHPIINPLSAQDEEILDNAKQKNAAIADLIARANHVGIDVTQHAGRNQLHADTIDKLKEMFFPTTMTPNQES
jgi:hypothetical protein